MSTQTQSKRLLRVPQFADIVGVGRGKAYDILRRHPELVVKVGERGTRVDPDKLDEWIARGGAAAKAA